MAAPTMMVRIAASLDELRRNLAEGKNQIEATTSGLQRMATAFQGDALIRKAHEMAAAVQQVGGASKLTEAEQAKVNRVVDAALQKYAALGREAPAALRELAAQTKQVEEKTGLLDNLLGPMKNKLIAAFSVGAVVGAVQQVAEFTGKISDLAAKTGITTDGIQKLQLSFDQAGVPIETVTNAVGQMAKRLMEGDKSAVGALSALGLSVDALKGMQPDQAFMAIADAVANVQNPMERSTLAMQVFGRSGADLLPGFTGHLKETTDEFQRMGLVVSSDVIAAGDEFGDQLGQLKAAGLALLVNVIGPMLPGLTDLAKWLSGAVSSSLQTARGGFNALVEAGLRVELWLREMVLRAAELSQKVPLLGKAFGASAEHVATLRDSAQQARDTLSAFTTQAAMPAKVAVEQAAPLTAAYARALEDTGKQAGAAAPRVQAATAQTEAFTGLVSRSLAETGKLTVALERWAFVNGATLAPSLAQVRGELQQLEPLVSSQPALWEQFKAPVTSAMGEATTSTGGFFSTLLQGAGGLSAVSGMFTQAFLGGGGALGAVKGFATQALSALMGMVPGVGPFLAAFTGPIVEGLSKLGGKIKDFFKGLFGGPSGDELAGRELVAKFEANLGSMLNDTQRMEAGNESWKQTVIAIRDAYIAAGLTEAQALRDAERLWASSREGAEASRRVIAEIEANMRGAGASAVAAVNGVRNALEQLPDRVTIPVDVETNGDGLPGFASGSGGIRDFGRGTLAVLHGRERVQTESQIQAERAAGGSSGADLSELVALMRALPRDMKVAFKAAMAGA